MSDSNQTDTGAAAANGTAQPTAASGATGADTANSSAQVASPLASAPKEGILQLLDSQEKAFKQLISDIAADGSRELSLAKTKVEEAAMWVRKHLA